MGRTPKIPARRRIPQNKKPNKKVCRSFDRLFYFPVLHLERKNRKRTVTPMEIYGDLYALLNFLADGLLLLLGGKLQSRPLKKRRILLSAGVGGLYAFLSLFLPSYKPLLLFLSFAVSLLMVRIAYPYEGFRNYLLSCLFFYISAILLSGGLQLFLAAVGRVLSPLWASILLLFLPVCRLYVQSALCGSAEEAPASQKGRPAFYIQGKILFLLGLCRQRKSAVRHRDRAPGHPSLRLLFCRNAGGHRSFRSGENRHLQSVSPSFYPGFSLCERQRKKSSFSQSRFRKGFWRLSGASAHRTAVVAFRCYPIQIHKGRCCHACVLFSSAF